MPNWCENSLEITADDKKAVQKLKKLKKKAVNKQDKYEDVFSMRRFVPAPRDIGDNWYRWNCDNWGTKWDVNEPFIEEEWFDDKYGGLKYGFFTAWSPPEEFVEKLGKLYPELNFFLRYEEPGVGYSGILRIIKGEIRTQKVIEWYD